MANVKQIYYSFVTMSILYYSNHAWHPHMQSWTPYDFKVENDIGPWCWFVNAEGGKLNQDESVI